MKKFIRVIFLLLFFIINTLPGKPLTAGLVEFDEKNDIGINNASVIVPKIIVSHLKNIGEYTLSERVLVIHQPPDRPCVKSERQWLSCYSKKYTCQENLNFSFVRRKK